jgi:hypothetical protein
MTSSTPIYVFIVSAVQRNQRLARVHYSDGLQDPSDPTRFRSYGAAGNFLQLSIKMSLLRSIPTPYETPGSYKTSRRFHG